MGVNRKTSEETEILGSNVDEGNDIMRGARGTSSNWKIKLVELYNYISSKMGAEDSSNKVTDLSTDDNIHYPTPQAVKTYVDAAVVGLLNDRGNYDASVNVFPSSGGSGTSGAIRKGDLWYISVA